MNLKKIIKQLHWHQLSWFASWHTLAGILAGSVLIIVSLTGAILIFESEIDVALNPKLFRYDKQGKRLSFSQATKRAKEQYPNLNYLGVFQQNELNDIYLLNVLPERYKIEDKYFKQIFVNPYTGKVTGIRFYENTFIGFVRKIHTSLLIPKIGKYLVGISALSCLLLVITGLRLWLPKSLQQVKSRLKIGWGKSQKRTNYDLHRVLGFYFSPVITMLSLSGVMITFAQISIAFLFLLNFQSPAKVKEILGQKSICENCHSLPISKIDSIAKSRFPKARLIGINFPQNKTASYMAIMSEQSASKLGTMLLVYIDQYSGKIQNHSNTKAFRLANVYFNWIKGIHFGKFGGWQTRILALLGSMAIAILFISGIIIWIPRWRKRKR